VALSGGGVDELSPQKPLVDPPGSTKLDIKPTTENAKKATITPITIQIIILFASSILLGSPLAIRNKIPAQMPMITTRAKNMGHKIRLMKRVKMSQIKLVAAKAAKGKSIATTEENRIEIFLFMGNY